MQGPDGQVKPGLDFQKQADSARKLWSRAASMGDRPQSGPIKRALLLLAALLFQVIAVQATYHGVDELAFTLGDERRVMADIGVPAPDRRDDLSYEAPPDIRPAELGGPLTQALNAADWDAGGGTPSPFHATNLLLHQISGLAVFWLLMLMLGRFGSLDPALRIFAALAGSLFWATHPIQVDAVAQIGARSTLAVTCFAVLTVAFYVQGRLAERFQTGWLGLAVIAAIACLFSGPMGWVAVVLVVIAEWTVIRVDAEKTELAHASDLPLLLAAVFVLAYYLLGAGMGFGPLGDLSNEQRNAWDMALWERMISHPRAVWLHFSQLILPLPGRFSVDHGLIPSLGLMRPLTTPIAMVGMFIWVGVTVYLFRRPGIRAWCFPLAWVVAALTVSHSVPPLDLALEHRMMLASVPFGLGVAFGMAWALTHRREIALGTGLGAFILIGLLMSASMQRVGVWSDDVTLFSAALEEAPKSVRLSYRLANALTDAGRWEESQPHYQRVAEYEPRREDALKPQRAHAYYKLGLISRQAGDDATAREHFLRALNIDARHLPSTVHLANIAVQQRLLGDAEVYLRRLIDLRPRNGVLYNDLGGILIERGALEDARANLLEALRLQPDLKAADENLRLVDRLIARRDRRNAEQPQR